MREVFDFVSVAGFFPKSYFSEVRFLRKVEKGFRKKKFHSKDVVILIWICICLIICIAPVKSDSVKMVSSLRRQTVFHELTFSAH